MKSILATLLITAALLGGLHLALGSPPPLMILDTGAPPDHVPVASETRSPLLASEARSPLLASEARSALLASEARMAVFGSPALSQTATPKIIALGASVVRDGFRPQDWARLAPDFEFHNAGVEASTPAALRHLWHHYDHTLAPDVAARSLVIVGVVYGMFNNTWKDKIADEEARLAPVFRSGLDSLLGPAIMGWIKGQTVRYFALDRSLRQALHPAWQGIETALRGSLGPPPAAPPAPAPLDQAAALAQWQAVMGHVPTLDPARFDEFEHLVTAIRQTGAKVVVVHMPLPAWHRAQSPYDRPFSATLAALMQRITAADPGILMVDIHKGMPDQDFRDSAHPARTEASAKWSQRVAEAIAERGWIPSPRPPNLLTHAVGDHNQ